MQNNIKKYPIYSLFTGPVLSGTSSMTGALEFLTLDLFRENQLDLILKDRSLVDNAINESLRFHASTGRFSRTVTTNTYIHGIHLQPGTRVAVCLDSANRDYRNFSNPDTFDLYRDTSGHLGFGYGVHACIALVVSKAVMSVYLNWLLDKFKKYRITTSKFNYVITQSGNDDMINNLVLEKI
jgi:cytochrome P450